MALPTGLTAVEDGMLRRIWESLLELVDKRVSVSVQFVFGHCNFPSNDLADKLTRGIQSRDQLVPTWITDMGHLCETSLRNGEKYRHRLSAAH